MPDHYYSAAPTSAHKPAHVGFAYRGHPLAFLTDSGVFSRLEIDQGTALLLHSLPHPLAGRVLDMGCGYGVIGLCVGKAYPDCTVTLADINERAVALAQENAKANGVNAAILQSDGYAALPPAPFDWILQNPPIRAGKAVIYPMFAEAAARLTEKGEFWLVVRKQQGAPSAVQYLRTLFSTVQVVEKKSGFWILRCLCPLITP